MKKFMMVTLLFLAACNTPPKRSSAQEIEDVGARTRNAFYDLGAQYGARCALEYATKLLTSKAATPIQDCIKASKKRYWEEHGLEDGKP